MKKNNRIPLIIGMILSALAFSPLLFTCNSYADISAPIIYEFDIIITNPNGAKARINSSSSEEIVIPVNTKLTVTYKQSNGDKTTFFTEYNDRPVIVDGSDADYAENNFDLSTAEEKKPLSQYIITDESCLYKGPDERYGKNDDNYCLPANIVISSTRYDDVWMYIEHDGHSGWIEHYNLFQKNPKTANIAINDTLITTRDKIELKDSPYEDGKVITTIEVYPLTEIPILYYFSTSKYISENYISYGEYSGWFHKDVTGYDIAFTEDKNTIKQGITIRDIKPSTTPDSDPEPEAKTIPANTEFKVLYSTGTFKSPKSYIKTTVEGQNIEGWIDDTDRANSTEQNYKYRTVQLEVDQPIFDTVQGTETGEKVEPGTYAIFYFYYFRNDTKETWYYIAKETSKDRNGLQQYDTIGWIKALSDEEVKELKEQREKEIEEAITNQEPKESESLTETEPAHDENNLAKDVITIIIWSLVGIFYVIIVIVIILVIYKKRKNASNDKTSGTKPDTTKPSETETKPSEKESSPETQLEPSKEESEPSKDSDEKQHE